MVATGMAFALWWLPVTRGVDRWFTPGDLWGIFRAAHYVAWGDLAGVYAKGNGVVAFPGVPILLAPVAAVSGWLHLTESMLPFVLPRPTSYLLLGPVEILLATVPVFGADALADRLGAGVRRRAVLCVAVGVLAWSASALWGHAEDALVVGIGLYALRAVVDGRWVRAGWLIGFAVACQPLILLALPILVAASPSGGRLGFALRSVALSSFLVTVSFLGDAADSLRALVDQPTPPVLNHATPWARLSPHSVEHVGAEIVPPGWPLVGGTGPLAHPHATMVFVSGGAARAAYVVAAVVVGLIVWRRPLPVRTLVWLVGVVLAARCAFEAVMTPYYLVPPLIVLLAVGARTSAARFAAAVAVGLATGWFAYLHLPPWQWWSPVVLGMAAVCVLTRPQQADGPVLPVDVGGAAVAS